MPALEHAGLAQYKLETSCFQAHTMQGGLDNSNWDTSIRMPLLK